MIKIKNEKLLQVWTQEQEVRSGFEQKGL